MEKNFNWATEIDHKKHLDKNTLLMLEICGIDIFLKLVETFNKSQYYFSSAPIYSMKKEFILKNKKKYTVKELSKMLDVSERFVYKIFKE